MKTFEIDEKQLQEIVGRLNSMTVQGITNNAHITGIIAVLEAVAKPQEQPSNVTQLPPKEEAHG